MTALQKTLAIVATLALVLIAAGILFFVLFLATCTKAVSDGVQEGERQSDESIKQHERSVKEIEAKFKAIKPPIAPVR